ncbi:hypothetical protein FRB96_000810 [Tulasnella sp. 330]|nr:hypothetical protein FRB96_000810 [Tulasnella sp. 330]KAG8881945.1 hypothetical protein FRB97_008903 [Tulasnella sp. 331]KAG8887955.1 hypothetical protein FRB98_008713 [Tulasnella sp. 332]
MSHPRSNDTPDVPRYVMELNNLVQNKKLFWKKDADAIDEKRGEGWFAKIYVDGKLYTSDNYYKKKADALASAAKRALDALQT